MKLYVNVGDADRAIESIPDATGLSSGRMLRMKWFAARNLVDVRERDHNAQWRAYSREGERMMNESPSDLARYM